MNVKKSSTSELLDSFDASSFDALIAIDEHGFIVVFSERAEEMFGYKKEEIIGKSIHILDTDIEEASKVPGIAGQEGMISNYATSLRNKKGEEIPILLSTTHLKDHNKIVIGQAGYIKDLRQPQLLNDRRRTLIDATEVIKSPPDLEELLQQVITSALSVFPMAQRAVLHLYNQKLNELQLSVSSYEYSPDAKNALSFAPGEGVAGWVYENQQSIILANASEDPRYKSINNPDVPLYKSMVCVPLREKENVIGVLSLSNTKAEGVFTETDLELLSTFADQVGITIENTKTFQQLKRHSDLSKSLVTASQNLTKTRDLDEQIHAVWDFLSKELSAPMFSIGLYDDLSNTIRFSTAYETGIEAEEPAVSLENEENLGVSGYVVRSGETLEWYSSRQKQKELGRMGIRHAWIGRPNESCIVTPLEFEGKVLGVISIQSEKPNAWDEFEIDAFKTLANQVAIALQNAQLFEEITKSNQLLYRAYEASVRIVKGKNPDQVLESILQQTLLAMGAWRARIVLFDVGGIPQRQISAGFDREIDADEYIRPNGLSRYVIQTKHPIFIENVNLKLDRIHPSMVSDGVQSAVCLPFQLEDKVLGVMWIHYNNPRRFSRIERNALQLYVNQAAIAYGNATRVEGLEKIRLASEALKSTIDLRGVLQQVVQSAKNLFKADSVILFPFEESRNRFNIELSTSLKIPQQTIDEFAKQQKSDNKIIKKVIKDGWVGVIDLERTKERRFVGKENAEQFDSIGIRSFQGISVKVGEELLGILYVNYQKPRAFTEEDITIAQFFANQAGLAIKNSRLLDQLKKSRKSAQSVAQLTVIGDLSDTLYSIVEGTREALDCDLVTLYTFDEDRKEFGFPPAMVGVMEPAQVLELGYVAKNSAVYRILELDEIYIAEDVYDDHLIAGPFTYREAIKSAIGIPLKVSDRRVGVMFVNYRNLHRFTEEEIKNVHLSAHQAAVAIINAQLYNKLQDRATELQALFEASKVISSSMDLDQILRSIVEQAVTLTSIAGSKAIFSYISLVENDKLYIKSSYPPDLSSQLNTIYGEVDLANKGGIGITGRAIIEGKIQLISDVSKDPDYIEFDRSTHSELAVPLVVGNEIIGVINVEHKDKNAFDEDDVRVLQALSALAGIAIKNTRQFEELQQTKGLIGARTAVAWMGMASSIWRHSVEGKAINIHNLLTLIYADIDNIKLSSSDRKKLEKRLRFIEKLTKSIIEMPITPPLSSEEVDDVQINELIKERIHQLAESEPYKNIKIELNLRSPKDTTIRSNPEWLRRALDIILNNAVDALEDSTVRKISISTKIISDTLEIAITDTGSGISNDVLSLLFHQRVEKKLETEEGLGMGLLIAQAIVSAYGGKIYVASTGSDGTTMSIEFPLEK